MDDTQQQIKDILVIYTLGERNGVKDSKELVPGLGLIRNSDLRIAATSPCDSRNVNI